MNIPGRFGKLVISAIALAFSAGAAPVVQESRAIEPRGNLTTTVNEWLGNPSSADRAGIERLHQQDMAATLSEKADELVNLWDTGAVRIQPGRPAEVSKAVIYANDKHWEARKGQEKMLCGRITLQDVQIAGDWAFEWGYFSYKGISREGKVSTGQGKVLRVLHRQTDTSWKFARVMNIDEKLASAAPVSSPCE